VHGARKLRRNTRTHHRADGCVTIHPDQHETVHVHGRADQETK